VGVGVAAGVGDRSGVGDGVGVGSGVGVSGGVGVGVANCRTISRVSEKPMTSVIETEWEPDDTSWKTCVRMPSESVTWFGGRPSRVTRTSTPANTRNSTTTVESSLDTRWTSHSRVGRGVGEGVGSRVGVGVGPTVGVGASLTAVAAVAAGVGDAAGGVPTSAGAEASPHARHRKPNATTKPAIRELLSGPFDWRLPVSRRPLSNLRTRRVTQRASHRHSGNRVRANANVSCNLVARRTGERVSRGTGKFCRCSR